MRVLDVTHESRSLSATRHGVLQCIRKHIGCDDVYWGAWSETRGGTASLGDSSHVAQPTSEVERYAREPERYDVPAAIERVRALGGVATDKEVFTSAERERLPLFSEVLRPAGIATYLSCMLEFRGRPLSVIVLSRRARHSRFRDADVRLMRAVRPGLGLAEVAAVAAVGRADVEVPSSSRRDELPRETTRELGLTPGEHRALALLERGLTNGEIAQILRISLHTVRNQLASAYRKLGVTRRAEAVYVLRT
jgi:DNA-binding CsgD family transcriptional regulator